MKKLFLLIILLGTAFVCRSQDFLNNPSFVCGVGATDDEALVSLAKSIQVSISAEQTYRVSEYKNKIEEEFEKTTSVETSLMLEAISRCAVINGTYYRYIDKLSYVNEKEAEYFYNIERADKLLSNKTREREKHEVNLLLGHYYNAYSSMSDPLIVAFIGKKATNRANYAKACAETIYMSRRYGWLSTHSKEAGGYSLVVTGGYDIPETAQPADLYGFEYSYNGIWSKATVYFDSENIVSDSDFNEYRNKVCRVRSNTPIMEYRILYESLIDGKLTKINVPDNWYFTSMKTANPRFY